MKRMIVGLSGLKQSGKTTAANRLVESGFVRISVADSMRDMIRSLLLSCGFSASHVELMLLSEKEQPIEGIGKSPRHIMQSLGTNWGREMIHKDIWLMAAANKINRLPNVNIVFDDVRFENEAAMIRKRGGKIIHINRPHNGPTDTHISEAGILRHDDDAFVVNNGSLEELYHAVFMAMG